MNLLREKLISRLKRLVYEFPGVMGISINDLIEEDEISINGDELFPIGSAIKIPILIEFYRQIEEGLIDPKDVIALKEKHIVGGSGVLKEFEQDSIIMPLINYAILMIVVSDNVAANILIDIVGMNNINKTLNSLGLSKTKLQRKMMNYEAAKGGRENISTPREMMILMKKIYRREGLSSYVCDNVLDMLKRPKEGIIRASIPDEIFVADKWGEVEGAICDVGIVFLQRRPYVIALMTKHVPLSDHHNLNTKTYMINMGRIVYDYFKEVDIATSLGRRFPR
ncbi:MAG: serine hydrolase [Candidatus Bathyarchaeia archaeon]